MEQRTTGEWQRGGGLSRRGNATSGSDPSMTNTRIARGDGPRTGPPRTDSGSAEPPPPPGRHRTPWGKPGRILPIRWGRIVVGCLAAAGVCAAIVGFALVSRGGHAARTASGPGSSAAGRGPDAPGTVAVLAPASSSASAGAGAPTDETGAVSSPAPGDQADIPPELSSAPPPPSAARSAAVQVSPPAQRAAGPILTLGRNTVDLGNVNSTDSVDLTNTGSAALDLRIAGGLPAWLTAVPRTTHLEAGFQTQLVITLDRSAAPVGSFDIPIALSAAKGSGGGTIHVTGQVSGGPRIVSLTPPAALVASACATDQAPAAGSLTVQVQDAIGMAGGTVVVTTPDGQSSTVTLKLVTTTDDQSTWSAPLGPSAAGTLGYAVTVKDLNDRTASQQGSLGVGGC
jgi:hypothetical protein